MKKQEARISNCVIGKWFQILQGRKWTLKKKITLKICIFLRNRLYGRLSFFSNWHWLELFSFSASFSNFIVNFSEYFTFLQTLTFLQELLIAATRKLLLKLTKFWHSAKFLFFSFKLHRGIRQKIEVSKKIRAIGSTWSGRMGQFVRLRVLIMHHLNAQWSCLTCTCSRCSCYIH